MATFHKLVVIGKLTRDPEFRPIANGGGVAHFGIGINFTKPKKNPTKDEQAARTKAEKACNNIGVEANKGCKAVFLPGSTQFVTRGGRKRSFLPRHAASPRPRAKIISGYLKRT